MKVFQLSYSNTLGGASRAASRIHHALRIDNIDSRMLVNIMNGDDWTVSSPTKPLDKIRILLSPQIAKPIRNLLITKNKMLHSPSIVPSLWPSHLNNSNADLVNLHWVGWEMLSIKDIKKIQKPLVWTLHDMWAFCGTEHYTSDFRWKLGYNNLNRPIDERGFDLNKWAWKRKLKNWNEPFNIVTPSKWLGECVKESALMRDWPVTIIPNPLDLNVWKPADMSVARSILNLPPDIPLILFGAMSGNANPIKGFDLLIEALGHLRNEGNYFELVIFGQHPPQNVPDFGFPVHYLGHLHDDISLRLVYSAANLMVVPSRLEAFGQTASEAQACGTPVVAFNTSGLRDIVDHKITGYLAKRDDSIDLACGIHYVLSKNRGSSLGEAGRRKVEAHFSTEIVAKQYRLLYNSILR